MSARICRFVKTVGPAAAAAAPETGAARVRGGGAAGAAPADSVTGGTGAAGAAGVIGGGAAGVIGAGVTAEPSAQRLAGASGTSA